MWYYRNYDEEKSKFTKKLTKIALVIGAEVLLFSGCLVMIYARGTGESENHGKYQENVTLGTTETNAGAENKAVSRQEQIRIRILLLRQMNSRQQEPHRFPVIIIRLLRKRIWNWKVSPSRKTAVQI